MPKIKSAIKKLRKDRKRERLNESFRAKIQKALRKAEKEKKLNAVTTAISLVDKAVKQHLFHRNKAARIKSKLTKLVKISLTHSGSKSKLKKKTVRIEKSTQKKKAR